MRALVILFLMALTVPASADAQRRQRGEPDANWNELDRFSRTTAPLTVRDIEAMSAVKHLLDERKKLKLTDEQQTRLKEIMATEKEGNRAAFTVIDSLRKLARGRPTAMTEEEQTRMSIARAELRVVVDSVMLRYRASATQALPVLDESQRTAATEVLERHREESMQTLRAKFAEMGQAQRPGSAGSRGRP